MHLKVTRALFSLAALIALAVLTPGDAGAHSNVSAQRKPAVRKKAAAVVYSCPMHPDVKSNRPGLCPTCRMELRAVKAAPGDAHEGHAGEAAPAGGATPATANGAATGTAAKGTTTLAPNSLNIPDTVVYNQHGQKLNFYTDLVRGRTVAINFIFTTCTTICPPLTATFRKVQEELGGRVGRDIELISVSVDPATDTPERLAAFSSKFKAAPGWTFVTGSKPEIDALLRALGAATGDKNDHTPMLLIGNDRTKKWTRSYGLARPAQISGLIAETADAK
jgi:cytochrome oxidase Cu insertion factor (SCO1/SenC/PrrC family)